MSQIIPPTPEQIADILASHSLWLDGKEGGKRADLSSADLRSANLSSADLSFANLSSADLSSADLRSADLRSANLRSANLSFADLRSANLSSADLTTGEKYELYLSEVVPALLTAGGKSIEEIVGCGAFKCHNWGNCPMRAAFGIGMAADGPPLLVPRIEQFVFLFDSGLIPEPVRGADGKWVLLPRVNEASK